MAKVFVANLAVSLAIDSSITLKMRDYTEKLGLSCVFLSDLKNDYQKIATEIIEADVFIADLTPFLSIEPDIDIVFLLGFATAKNKPVFTYTNVDDSFCVRTKNWNNNAFMVAGLLKFDKDGNRIENMGKEEEKVKIIEYNQDDINFSDADNQNNLMLEGPSLTSNSFVLTPNIIGTKILYDRIYNNLEVFIATINIVKQRVQLGQLGVQKFINTSNSIKEFSFYLAGPDVFFTKLNEIFAIKKQITNKFGFLGIAPIENQIDFAQMQTWKSKVNGNNIKMRKEIYMDDVQTMNNTAGGIFNFTPFRGVFADSGTVFEFGYTVGLNKPFSVYSNDPRKINERINEWGEKYGGKLANGLYNQNVYYGTLVDLIIRWHGRSATNTVSREYFKNLYYNKDKQIYYSDTVAFEKSVKELSLLN